MLVAFEVDCGDAIPGHRLLANGLREDGFSDDSMLGDYSHHYDGKPVHRMVSVDYTLVPGLESQELDGSHRDVDAIVTLDPPANADHWDTRLTPGGERDAIPGRSETKGAFGPFVLPDQTKRIAVELSAVTIVPDGARTPPDLPRTDPLLGTLDIELPSGAARWTPA
jgi:hypothetical protein